MSDVSVILLVLYLCIGAIVYFVTDSNWVVSDIEAVTPFSFGFIRNGFFVFVLILWPLWLMISRGPENRP